MKITVNRMRHILTLVSPIIARRAGGTPTDQYVLMENGYAIANVKWMAISADMPELAEGEKYIIHHRTLSDLLKYVPGSAILTIETANNQYSITSNTGDIQTRLKPGNGTLWPPFPEMTAGTEGEVNGDWLVENLSELRRYAAASTASTALNGVCIILGETLELASTNGHRLAWKMLPIRLLPGKGDSSQVIIKKETISVLEKMWKAADKVVRPSTAFNQEQVTANPLLSIGNLAAGHKVLEVGIGSGKVRFGFGEATLTADTIDAVFPDYHQIIPKNPTHRVSFNPAAAARAVNTITPMAGGKGYKIIKMAWNKDQLTFSTNNQDVGDAAVAIRCQSTGRGSSKLFALEYLADVFARKSGLMIMETSQPTSPALFMHQSMPNTLVMPLQDENHRSARSESSEQTGV